MAEAQEMLMEENLIPEFRDYYLKFNSEEEAKSILFSKAPLTVDESDPENVVVTEWAKDESGEDSLRPNFANIATVGQIYRETGEMIRLAEEGVAEEDQLEVPAMAPIDGWHVNVRVLAHEDPSVLEAYKTNPDPITPKQVFA